MFYVSLFNFIQKHYNIVLIVIVIMYRFENYPRSILHFQKSLFTHKKEGLDAYSCTIHWRFYAVKKKKTWQSVSETLITHQTIFENVPGFFEKKFCSVSSGR